MKVVLTTARRLAATLGDRPLARATTTDLREFLAALAPTVAATTQAAYFRRLCRLFATLRADGLCATDPTAPIYLQPSHPSPRVLLDDAQVAKLLTAASQVQGDGPLARAHALRDRCCLELLYGLGLRSVEVRRAKLIDLDLRDGTLHVRRAKRGLPERLPLPRSSLPHVSAWLDHGRPLLAAGAAGHDDGALLLRNDGRPIAASGVGKLVRRAAGRAGVRAHPHAFRRAVATGLVRAGTSVPIVQRALGHVSLKNTAVYIAVAEEDLRATVDILDRLRRS